MNIQLLYIQICFINNFKTDWGKAANWKMSKGGKTLNTTPLLIRDQLSPTRTVAFEKSIWPRWSNFFNTRHSDFCVFRGSKSPYCMYSNFPVIRTLFFVLRASLGPVYYYQSVAIIVSQNRPVVPNTCTQIIQLNRLYNCSIKEINKKRSIIFLYIIWQMLNKQIMYKQKL